MPSPPDRSSSTTPQPSITNTSNVPPLAPNLRDTSTPSSSITLDESGILEWQQENQRKREVITSTYRQVWMEFYDWEPGECAQIIGSLVNQHDHGWQSTTTTSSFPDSESEFWGFHSDTDRMLVDEDSPRDTDTALTFTITDFNPHLVNPRNPTAHTVPVASPIISALLEPQPSYTACTPSSFNLKVEGDPTILRFIKYAGEDGFDERGYSLLFESFSWQSDWHDPDETVIISTVISRLTHRNEDDEELDQRNEQYPRLSHTTIDYHKILPQSIEQITSKMYQRDPLYWPGHAFEEGSNIPTISISDHLLSRVNNMRLNFCHYMDCIRPVCFLHNELWNLKQPDSPSITNEELKHKVNKPCSPGCFLSMSLSYDSTEEKEWSSKELQDLEAILDLLPDSLPCDMAVLCKKQCYQIYIQRLRLIPDGHVQDKVNYKIVKPPGFKYKDINGSLEFTGGWPCVHPGPCDQYSECACFQDQLHCSRNCSCNSSCTLQYKGCKCDLVKKQCDYNTNCSCVKMSWECNPEICHTRKHKIKKCKNCKIQKGFTPHLSVQRGKYGLGLFTTEKLSKSTHIGEYIADTYPIEDNTREFLWNYSGLNYNYELNTGQTLDAITVGNGTRYMNHKEAGKNNVQSGTSFVNGEHRIFFETAKAVSAGHELFLYYGEKFFPQDAEKH